METIHDISILDSLILLSLYEGNYLNGNDVFYLHQNTLSFLLSLYEGNYLNGNPQQAAAPASRIEELSLYEGNYLNGNVLFFDVYVYSFQISPFMRETT